MLADDGKMRLTDVGSVAKAARTQLEKQLGHSVVSPIYAAQVLAAKDAEQIEGSFKEAAEACNAVPVDRFTDKLKHQINEHLDENV